MAFRANLKYVNLKATVSFSKIRVVVSQEKTRTSLSFTDAKTSVHHQLVKTLVEYVNLNSLVQYVNLSAVDILLDPDSKNLYFIPQNDSPNAVNVTMLEDTAFAVAKTLTDIPVVTDAPALETAKPLSDSVAFGEVVAKLLTFERVFTDNFSMQDAPALSLSTVVPDDFVSLGDVPLLAPTLGKTDTVTVSESFSRVVTFARSFTDAVSLDDLASLSDPLQTDVDSNKTNVFGFTDAHSYALSRFLSDTYGLADTPAIGMNRPATDTVNVAESSILGIGLNKTDTPVVSETLALSLSNFYTDSATISEVINVVTISSHSVLNASGLNSGTLN
tara:strand:+ start:3296 stop:4291 length:996 start_codon:yes stop_codon:yes gene_type:complete